MKNFLRNAALVSAAGLAINASANDGLHGPHHAEWP